jgi:hypothetical protein
MTDEICEIELDVDKFAIPYEWIILSDNDSSSFIAPGILPEYYQQLRKSYGIDYKCYDYDPKFRNIENYVIKDVIFDSVDISGLIVNFNCHKMYPIGKIFSGEMILIGSDNRHNGDCNPILDVQQLIEQNNIHTVYRKAIATHYGHEQFNYKTYMVWGRND